MIPSPSSPDLLPAWVQAQRLAVGLRARDAFTITNDKVCDDGVEEADYSWDTDSKDPDTLVGMWPVSVTYYTNSPPGFYEDTLALRVRFIAGTAIPVEISASCEQPLAGSVGKVPATFLSDERQRAIEAEEKALRSTWEQERQKAVPCLTASNASQSRSRPRL